MIKKGWKLYAFGACSLFPRESRNKIEDQAASPEAQIVVATKWQYCFSIVQSADGEG